MRIFSTCRDNVSYRVHVLQYLISNQQQWSARWSDRVFTVWHRVTSSPGDLGNTQEVSS